jgi:hypothetical protein
MAWLAGGRQLRRRVLSKPEPQVSYLRELRPETTASQLQRAAVRHVPVRRHGPVWEVVSWLRTGSGLSNNQIGQRLFLSPRTAGGHLHRIFPKLGITSQAALYAALTSLPPAQKRERRSCCRGPGRDPGLGQPAGADVVGPAPAKTRWSATSPRKPGWCCATSGSLSNSLPGWQSSEHHASA